MKKFTMILTSILLLISIKQTMASDGYCDPDLAAEMIKENCNTMIGVSDFEVLELTAATSSFEIYDDRYMKIPSKLRLTRISYSYKKVSESGEMKEMLGVSFYYGDKQSQCHQLIEHDFLRAPKRLKIEAGLPQSQYSCSMEVAAADVKRRMDETGGGSEFRVLDVEQKLSHPITLDNGEAFQVDITMVVYRYLADFGHRVFDFVNFALYNGDQQNTCQAIDDGGFALHIHAPMRISSATSKP